MPIYDYICVGCGTEFERFHKVINRDENVSCPRCTSKNVKRQISLTVYPAWSTFLDKMEQRTKRKPWGK